MARPSRAMSATSNAPIPAAGFHPRHRRELIHHDIACIHQSIELAGLEGGKAADNLAMGVELQRE
jgi:hypothetical protein